MEASRPGNIEKSWCFNDRILIQKGLKVEDLLFYLGCRVERFYETIKEPYAHLSHRRGQEVDYPVVGDGDHALAVDLDDAVADADPSALGDATAEQTADLK